MSQVFSDLKTVEYGTPGHPEAPFRVKESHARLCAAGHRLETPPNIATAADVALLHGPKHFERVSGGGFLDADTPAFDGIADIALISLSGALCAAASAVQGAPAFSLMRPPGHHAGKDSVRGFCYFNNLALSCAKLQAEKKAAKIAILDIDVHHGDGTDELMTKRAGVMFCSLHQVPLYPGSGLKSHDNCLNIPLPPGTGEAAYLKEVEKSLESLLAFKPEVLAVSAGFDTYKEDPIAQLKLEKGSYRRLGDMIAQTKLKRFAVLEGGYAPDLPILIENFLAGFFG
ncbi:MAG: histone deacetylase [Elusimicrobia bacterium]|nr:histone deacetylase [Elusimicrobiota bacterium]